MFKDKKFKLFIAFLALFICISQLKDTYAKYLEAKEGNTDFTIANWKIVVNDKDISEGSTLSSLITPVYVANQNIASGVIAPSSEGYFDLNIDASAVDVSFTYNILIEENDLISDFIITGYQIGDNPIVNLTDTTEITNDILLDDTNRLQTIRIYFEWYDEDDNKMDNNADTVVTIDNDNLTLNVKLSFTQKK